MLSFVENMRHRYGDRVANTLSEVLSAMDLPDAKYGTYLEGTEGGALFLNRYGLLISVAPEAPAPEHDLILQPLCKPHKVLGEGGRTIEISILPGIEGVLKSYSDVNLLRGVLAAAGIDFWDIQGAKGLKNGGYLKAELEGFPNGVPLVLDRGGVEKSEAGPREPEPNSLAAAFNPDAVKGLQQKYFARFRDSLARAWPEGGTPLRKEMREFLQLCRDDIDRGRGSSLSNRWAANYQKMGMAFVDKPLEVSQAAAGYERQMKWRAIKRGLHIGAGA
jgi:hypothetical protein